MTLGVRWYLVGSFILVALIALAGCSHYMLAEREPWRHDAEIACLNSGAVKKSPTRVRISSISGPGACGADYPLRVSALGDSGPLGYSDEAPVPPGAIPNASMPQHWPVTQPSAAPSSGVSSQQLPPLQAGAPQSYRAGLPAAAISAAIISAAVIPAAIGDTGRATVVAQSARLAAARRR